MRIAFLHSLLLLAFSLASLPTQAQIKLGMSIQEFSYHYPELAPRRIGFTGQLSRDSTWHGLDWNMSFAFGDASMSGAIFDSEKVGADPDSLKEAFDAIVEEFTEYYGPSTHKLDSVWPLPYLPDDSLAEYRGYRQQWMFGNSAVWVELQPSWSLKVDSIPHSYSYFLRVELTSTTRRIPGLHAPISPMVIGMRIEQFGAFHPQFVSKGVGYRGIRSRPEKLGSMLGEWNYWFEQGELQRYYWLRTYQEYPNTNPSQYSTVQLTTRALIEQLETAVGPPTERHAESDSLVENGMQMVEKAVWILEKEKITVFMGVHDGSKGVGYQLRWSIDPVATKE